AGVDRARNRLVATRRAGLAQHLGGGAQLARQYDQGAIDVDPRTVDLDRPGNPELRGGRHDAVRRPDELAGSDRDVAAMAFDCLGLDAAVIEDPELRVDRDVAAVPGPALDRGRDLAADQIKE